MCSYSAAPGGQAGPVALVPGGRSLVPGGQAGPVAAGRVAWWWPGRPRCLVCHYIVAPGGPGVCDPVAMITYVCNWLAFWACGAWSAGRGPRPGGPVESRRAF
jgi:hypothetical protein